MGWNMPHGGHSKSPNSSMWTGAFGGPSVCGGSAPGTPVRTATGVGFACDDGVVWPAVWVAPVDDEEGCTRVRYKALPSAAPRTARMMTNGSIRFMSLAV